jgi:hypothetical protein
MTQTYDFSYLEAEIGKTVVQNQLRQKDLGHGGTPVILVMWEM